MVYRSPIVTGRLGKPAIACSKSSYADTRVPSCAIAIKSNPPFSPFSPFDELDFGGLVMRSPSLSSS